MLRLNLPAKSGPSNVASTKVLTDGLTSVIAGHPGAVEPWTFYDVLDEYLGPWGDRGYPIAYGKYYCIVFNKNEKLLGNPQTREWVRKTTIALQEPLRDFVVARYKAGTLATLTESELRAYAFSVHPSAYVQGGLTMVVLTAPELVPIIASIPSAQFNPHSENFGPTVTQVFATMGQVLPQATGMSLAALAGPAHTGILSRAAQLDARDLQRDVTTSQWLSETQRRLKRGQLDNFALLNKLTSRLNDTQFEDQALARAAREVIQVADTRKHRVASYYRNLLATKPALGGRIDQLYPGWRTW